MVTYLSYTAELGFHELTTPSLKQNVTHAKIDPYGQLADLELPLSYRRIFYDAPDLIDFACCSIISRIPDDTSKLVVGLTVKYDTEIQGHSGLGKNLRPLSIQVDLIQIAMEDVIYIFKVPFL